MLAIGACAEAHGRDGHIGLHRLGLHRGAGAALGVPRAALRDRNIRSGDHFSWRQGHS